MAGKGTYGAYANAKEVGEDFNENLKHAERMGFAYRQEEERKKVRRDARRKELAATLGTSLEELNIDQSGIKDIDLPVYEYIERTADELTNLASRIARDENDFEAQVLYSKYENNGKKLKSFVDKFAAAQADYQAGLASGKYSKTNNADMPLKLSEALQRGQYKLLNDKNGDLQVFIDLDGDGKQDPEFATINVAEFLSGNKAYQPKLRHSKFAEQDAIFKRFGELTEKVDGEGYMEIEYTGFDPSKEDDLKRVVDTTLGSYDKMTEKATSILGDDLGIDPKDLTEKEFNAFKDQFTEEIKNLQGTTVSEKYNWRRDHADQANQRAWKADKRAEKKANGEDNGDNQEYISRVVDPRTGEPTQLSVDGETEAAAYSLPSNTDTTVDGFPVVGAELYGDGSLGFVIEKTVVETKQDENGDEYDEEKTVREAVTDTGKLSTAVRNIKHPLEDRNFNDLTEFREILEVSDELEALDQEFPNQ